MRSDHGYGRNAGASRDRSPPGAGPAFDIDVMPTADAPATARAAFDRALSGRLADRVLDDARVVLSELVTNSVRHAGLTAAQRVHVVATVDAARLRLEVDDAGTSGTVAPRTPDSDGGFGLQLVDAISARWGVERNDHTCVWAELDSAPRV
jgi:serine/threonine-protein kinase RsbW